MNPHEVVITHDSADRYESARTLAQRYIKEVRLDDYAWQWAVWFLFNGDQCGTRCPYWPEVCYVGSDTCCECPGFEGIQIITKHSGRVFAKQKRFSAPLARKRLFRTRRPRPTSTAIPTPRRTMPLVITKK